MAGMQGGIAINFCYFLRLVMFRLAFRWLEQIFKAVMKRDDISHCSSRILLSCLLKRRAILRL